MEEVRLLRKSYLLALVPSCKAEGRGRYKYHKSLVTSLSTPHEFPHVALIFKTLLPPNLGMDSVEPWS